jgi:hypothetical protein
VGTFYNFLLKLKRESSLIIRETGAGLVYMIMMIRFQGFRKSQKRLSGHTFCLHACAAFSETRITFSRELWRVKFELPECHPLQRRSSRFSNR